METVMHPVLKFILFFILYAVLACLLLFVGANIATFAIMRPSFRVNSCVSNQKQLAMLTAMYAVEHEEKMVGKKFWSVIDVKEEMLRCPEAGKKVSNSYAYNELLANVEIKNIADPENTIMLADSDSNNNLMITSRDIAIRHTKKTKAVIAFVAGHVILTDDFRNVKFKNELKKEEKKP